MCHLQQLGRPRGYHAQCNKSDRIRQILYNPTYNRSLKKNKQKNNEPTTETESQIQRANWWLLEERSFGGQAKQVKVIKRYIFPVVS